MLDCLFRRFAHGGAGEAWFARAYLMGLKLRVALRRSVEGLKADRRQKPSGKEPLWAVLGLRM